MEDEDGVPSAHDGPTAAVHVVSDDDDCCIVDVSRAVAVPTQLWKRTDLNPNLTTQDAAAILISDTEDEEVPSSVQSKDTSTTPLPGTSPTPKGRPVPDQTSRKDDGNTLVISNVESGETVKIENLKLETSQNSSDNLADDDHLHSQGTETTEGAPSDQIVNQLPNISVTRTSVDVPVKSTPVSSCNTAPCGSNGGQNAGYVLDKTEGGTPKINKASAGSEHATQVSITGEERHCECSAEATVSSSPEKLAIRISETVSLANSDSGRDHHAASHDNVNVIEKAVREPSDSGLNEKGVTSSNPTNGNFAEKLQKLMSAEQPANAAGARPDELMAKEDDPTVRKQEPKYVAVDLEDDHCDANDDCDDDCEEPVISDGENIQASSSAPVLLTTEHSSIENTGGVIPGEPCSQSTDNENEGTPVKDANETRERVVGEVIDTSECMPNSDDTDSYSVAALDDSFQERLKMEPDDLEIDVGTPSFSESTSESPAPKQSSKLSLSGSQSDAPLDDSFSESLQMESADFEIDKSTPSVSGENKKKKAAHLSKPSLEDSPKRSPKMTCNHYVVLWNKNGRKPVEPAFPPVPLIPQYVKEGTRKHRINDYTLSCLPHCSCSKNPKYKGVHYHCIVCNGFTTDKGELMVRHRVMKHQNVIYGVNVLQCCICSHMVIHVSEYIRHLKTHAKIAYIFTEDVQKFLESEMNFATKFGFSMKNAPDLGRSSACTALDFKQKGQSSTPTKRKSPVVSDTPSGHLFETTEQPTASEPQSVPEKNMSKKTSEPITEKERITQESVSNSLANVTHLGDNGPDTSTSTQRAVNSDEGPVPPNNDEYIENTEATEAFKESNSGIDPSVVSISGNEGCDLQVPISRQLFKQYPLDYDIEDIYKESVQNRNSKKGSICIVLGKQFISSELVEFNAGYFDKWFDKKNKSYSCPFCDLEFEQKCNCSLHIIRQHRREAPVCTAYVCKACNFWSGHKNNFLQHLKSRVHLQPNTNTPETSSSVFERVAPLPTTTPANLAFNVSISQPVTSLLKQYPLDTDIELIYKESVQNRSVPNSHIGIFVGRECISSKLVELNPDFIKSADKMHFCPVCARKYGRKDHCANHIIRYHKCEGPATMYVCEVCNYWAVGKVRLSIHLASVEHQRNANTLAVDSCSKSVASTSAESDAQIQPIKSVFKRYPIGTDIVTIYKESARNRIGQQGHIFIVIGQEFISSKLVEFKPGFIKGEGKRYDCPICASTFERKYFCVVHVVTQHKRVAPCTVYACERCDVWSAYQPHFLNHIKSKRHRARTKPLRTECSTTISPDCGSNVDISQPSMFKKYPLNTDVGLIYGELVQNRAGQKGHIRIVVGRDFICSKLVESVNIKCVGKMYSCPICAAKFHQKFHCASHMVSKHKCEAPTTMYMCDVCNFWTPLRHRLVNHLKGNTHKTNTTTLGADSSENILLSVPVPATTTPANSDLVQSSELKQYSLDIDIDSIYNESIQTRAGRKGFYISIVVGQVSISSKLVQIDPEFIKCVGRINKKYLCPICPSKFDLKGHCAIHVIQRHKCEGPSTMYICEVCNFWVTFRNRIVAHLKSSSHKTNAESFQIKEITESPPNVPGPSKPKQAVGPGKSHTKGSDQGCDSKVPSEVKSYRRKSVAKNNPTTPGYIPLIFPIGEVLKSLEYEYKYSSLLGKYQYILEVTKYGIRKEVRERDPTSVDKVIFSCQLCKFKTKVQSKFELHCSTSEHEEAIDEHTSTTSVSSKTKSPDSKRVARRSLTSKPAVSTPQHDPPEENPKESNDKDDLPRLWMSNNAGTVPGNIPLTTDLEQHLPKGEMVALLRITKFGVRRQGGDGTNPVLLCDLCNEKFGDRDSLLTHCSTAEHKAACEVAVEESKTVYTNQFKGLKEAGDDSDDESGIESVAESFSTETDSVVTSEPDVIVRGRGRRGSLPPAESKEAPSSTTGPSERTSQVTKSRARKSSSIKSKGISRGGTSAQSLNKSDVSSSSNAVTCPTRLDVPQVLKIRLPHGKKTYIVEGRIHLKTSFFDALDALRQKRPEREVNNIQYEIVVTMFGFVQYRHRTKVGTGQPQAPQAVNMIITCGRDGCDFQTTSQCLWEAHTADRHSAVCRYIYHCKLVNCKFKCLLPKTFYRHESDQNHAESLKLAAKTARNVYREQEQARKGGLAKGTEEKKRKVEKQPSINDSVESDTSPSNMKSSKDKVAKTIMNRTQAQGDEQSRYREDSRDEWKPPAKRSRKLPPAYPRRTTRGSKGLHTSPPAPPAPEPLYVDGDSDDDVTPNSPALEPLYVDGDSEDDVTPNSPAPEPIYVTGDSEGDVTPSTSPSKRPIPPAFHPPLPKRMKTTARKSTSNKVNVLRKVQEEKRVKEKEKEKEKSTSPPTKKSLDDIDSETLLNELKSRKVLHPCHCGMLFSNTISFYLHVGCHSHNNPKICNHCDYEAQNWMDFHSHFFNHTRESVVKDFQKM